MLKRIPRIPRIVLLPFLLAVTALAAFVATNVLGQDQLGQPGDPAAVDALKADSEKPRFAGAIAGIRLTAGGADSGPEVTCGQLFQNVPVDSTKGTAFEIGPTFLPAGLGGETSPPSATACQGKLVGSGRSWAPSQAGGPWIWIQRVLRPEPWSYSYAPIDRISSGGISTAARKDIPAVFIKPVLPDGRGGSFVIFTEKTEGGFVVTLINGEGVTLDQLKKVAEGLTR
jgi:hypothetical protein